eukprot:10871710-Prorocentrum_lima.AAC.1
MPIISSQPPGFAFMQQLRQLLDLGTHLLLCSFLSCFPHLSLLPPQMQTMQPMAMRAHQASCAKTAPPAQGTSTGAVGQH